MFVEEKKESKPANEQKHGVLSTIVLMLLTWFLTLLGWICKPLFLWLFDFRDTSKELAITKAALIFTLLGSLLLLVWQLKIVRDLTLSNSHTINRNETGVRILFPDRSYFVVEGNSRPVDFGGNSSKKYLTYAGYTKNTAQKVGPSTCQIVPRNESAMLASEDLPVEAEGFTDTVEYTLVQKLPDLPWWIYIKEHSMNPKYFLMSSKERRDLMVSYTKEATWGEFERDWENLFSFPDRHKPFEVKAKFYEHAVICF